MTKILDCTIRDGGHCANWVFSEECIYNLMSTLNQNEISFFEIGYRNFKDREGKGNFYYCTPDFIKNFYGNKGVLNLGVMVDTKRFNENDFINGKEDYVDFVRIATHPERIGETLSIAETLYKRDYTVMLQLMDMTKLTDEHYQILESWSGKNIPKTVYLADTYGTAKTEEVEKHYKKLNNIGYKNISFHAHNHSGLALVNTKKAIELGAYSVDVSQDGIGIN
jgi:4-hydroxy 2-oxovalerate aldolase